MTQHLFLSYENCLRGIEILCDNGTEIDTNLVVDELYIDFAANGRLKMLRYGNSKTGVVRIDPHSNLVTMMEQKLLRNFREQLIAIFWNDVYPRVKIIANGTILQIDEIANYIGVEFENHTVRGTLEGVEPYYYDSNDEHVPDPTATFAC